MSRISRLVLALFVLPVLAACAGTGVTTEGGSGSSAPSIDQAPPPELLLVRPQGPQGPLVAYDVAEGSARFALPAGMASANGERYYATTARAGETRLEAFDPSAGVRERTFRLSGEWALSGVSPTGRWLALTRAPGRSDRTAVAIVDASDGQVAHVLELEGNFEVETISAAGDSLFLVQHLPAHRYLIRLYDLSREALLADPLRSKGADEVMAGLAWGGLASPDGSWLLTLYLSTRRDVAFIHALNLRGKYPFCIDLPSNGRFEQLKRYSLALSPDGRTVYATNVALGVVAEVDLSEPRVVRTTTFPAHDPAAPSGHSVISDDGRTVYFTGGRDVWAFDTRSGTVRGPFQTGGQVGGLGVSRDGRRLYVARTDGQVLALDAAGGEAVPL